MNATGSTALVILCGVGVYLLIIPTLTNQLGANPIERLHRLAYVAAIVLIFHQSIASLIRGVEALITSTYQV